MASADQKRQKARKHQIIVTNWRSSIKDAIPSVLQPRTGCSKVKAKIGSTLPPAPWTEWSLGLLDQLATFSAMTAGKLGFAQELMTLEVQQRQQDCTHGYKEWAELTLRDVEKMIKELRERADEDEESLELDRENSEEEVDEGAADEGLKGSYTNHRPEPSNDSTTQTSDRTHTIRGTESDEVPVHEPLPKKIKLESPKDVTTTFPAPAAPVGTPAPVVDGYSATKEGLKAKARVASLRGDAYRLKQAACRRIAEAFELEAKLIREDMKSA